MLCGEVQTENRSNNTRDREYDNENDSQLE